MGEKKSLKKLHFNIKGKKKQIFNRKKPAGDDIFMIFDVLVEAQLDVQSTNLNSRTTSKISRISQKNRLKNYPDRIFDFENEKIVIFIEVQWFLIFETFPSETVHDFHNCL